MQKIILDDEKTWDLAIEFADELRQLIHAHIAKKTYADGDNICSASLFGHIDALANNINLLQFDKNQVLNLFHHLLYSDAPRHQGWNISGLELRAEKSHSITDKQESFYKLGVIYKNGIGVEQDLEKSFNYFLQGAQLEHADSMFAFVDFLSDLDLGRKISLYQKAAQKGSAEAHYELGVIFGEDNSFYKNNNLQIYHYKLAAARDFLPAIYNLGWIYQNGDPEVTDYRQAIFWYELAANKNHLGAINNLGEIYLIGQGVDVNKIEALKWFILAINDKFNEPELKINEIRQVISHKEYWQAVKEADNWISDRPYLKKKLMVDKN
jgi:TPR repeat protein